MRFLLLNQTFYPDVVATGQYLAEVAQELVARGHEVTVVASRRAYDHPEKQFPKTETWRGIHILRIGSTAFGKTAKWRRALDFSSFLAFCALRLAFLPRQDAILALTSPPLISFLGALFIKLRGGRFFYWVMDFNPDEAIAAGWLRANSLPARFLDALSRFSLKHAKKIIALDRFMKDRIVAKGVAADKVAVIPPWSHDDEVHFDPVGRERFREKHRLQGKFVVMYSGNHSPCHPLTTLLQSAERLANEPEFAFCFIGGGSEWRKIQAQLHAPTSDSGLRSSSMIQTSHFEPRTSDFGSPSDLGSRSSDRTNPQPADRPSTLNPQPSTPCRNLLLLPYEPLSELSASLSAADLHIVVMGDPFVGLVHPCKIYNILSVGSPVLCIGPASSHLTDILSRLNPDYPSASVRHGDVDQVVAFIKRVHSETPTRPFNASSVSRHFSKSALLPNLVAFLETSSPPSP